MNSFYHVLRMLKAENGLSLYVCRLLNSSGNVNYFIVFSFYIPWSKITNIFSWFPKMLRLVAERLCGGFMNVYVRK